MNIIEAAQKGNINSVKESIHANSDVNGMDSSGWTALMYASSDGNLDIVKALITAGANVNTADKAGELL